MKSEKVSHIGIAVKNLEEAVKFYVDALNLEVSGYEIVKEQKAKVAFISCGETRLELLESTSPDGPIGKYLEKNNGRSGIHHIAIEVSNIEEALDEMGKKGYKLIDKEPRGGADGAKIAFVHPKATGGVLIELCMEE
jgi:methylmalonyl-CoA/ethylmalonyl-CoA epimerase